MRLPRFLVPKRPPAGEIAAPNVGQRLQQYIGELPPDPRSQSRYAHSWRDDSAALRLYRDVLRDERCQAALDQRLDAAIARPWEVEPGGRTARDKRAAAHLTETLRAIDFNPICRQLLFGVWYGYAVAEAVWGRDGNRVVLRDLAVRSPDRFRWAPDGSIMLRTESSPYGEEVPPGKFVTLARAGEHRDLPHGPGIARWCFWPVWMRRNGLKFWAVALERFGAPTVKGTYPPGADEKQKNDLLDLVQAFATSVGVTMPEGQDIALVDTAQRSGGDFEVFCQYLDRSISNTILGQSSTTDQGPWRGTAEVQKSVRDETIAADCRLLDNSLSSTIAHWLTTWNFPGAAIPRIVRDASPPDDLDARAKREEIVSRTTGLRPTRRHVEQVYGGEWEDAPPPPLRPALPPAGESDYAALAGGRSRDAFDAAVTDFFSGEGWEPMMEPIIEPILEAARGALERGESLEAFRDRLPELLAEMDDSRLVETLRRMGFSARLSGDAGLSEVTQPRA